MNKLTVLYICHDEISLGGAALSLKNMISSVAGKIEPVILFREHCIVSDYFETHGVRCVYSQYDPWAVIKYPDTRPLFWRCGAYIKNYLLQRKSARVVYEDLKWLRVDIVHSNSSVFVVGHFLAKWMHAKHVWHIRESQNVHFKIMPIIGWKWMRRLMTKSERVICITEAVAKQWEIYGKKNVVVRWDAVRKRTEVCYIPVKKPYFLFCAAFISEEKGIKDAIEAFAKSGLHREGYTLKVVGNLLDSNLKKWLKLHAEQLGIAEQIAFVGPTDNVKPYMAEATAFLMCSLFEGLGRVTVEAMFYGCPVIGRNSGGTAEIVTHGETGLLYDTVDECAVFMNMVATTNMKPMCKRAQQFAIDNFSEENYGEFIMSVYNS